MPSLLLIKTGSTVPSLLSAGEDFEHWFAQGLGLAPGELLVCAVHEGEPLPDLARIDGIVITGSPANVTDLAPWNYEAGDYLRLACDRGVPILGVCYGHQLLAWAFGGEVGFHAKGREIGTVSVQLTEQAKQDPLFRELPDSFPAQASHQQSVLALPPQAVLLAANEFDPHHAFRLGECCWGVQFHPEFDARIISAYLESRRDILWAEGLDADRLLAAVTPSPDAASLLGRFAGLVRETVD